MPVGRSSNPEQHRRLIAAAFDTHAEAAAAHAALRMSTALGPVDLTLHRRWRERTYTPRSPSEVVLVARVLDEQVPRLRNAIGLHPGRIVADRAEL